MSSDKTKQNQKKKLNKNYNEKKQNEDMGIGLSTKARRSLRMFHSNPIHLVSLGFSSVSVVDFSSTSFSFSFSSSTCGE